MSTKIGTTTLKSSSRIPLNKREYAKKRGVTKLVAPRCVACSTEGKKEFPPSPCKKKCEILLQKPMKKRSAVILVNWGEILEKKSNYL